jgi:hypothetical protein
MLGPEVSNSRIWTQRKLADLGSIRRIILRYGTIIEHPRIGGLSSNYRAKDSIAKRMPRVGHNASAQS